MPVSIVGDIHGCHDLMVRLFDKIDPGDHIITVGDYVDRGEKSADVLRWLMAQQTANPDRITCLLGNHEVMMLEFLDDPSEKGARWLHHGGLQTLASFGVRGANELMKPDELIAVRDRFRAALPTGLEDWVRSLPKHWSSGNLWVVHAAADPAVAMSEQGNRALLWGSSTFLNVPRTDGIWVAHGHTVIEPPEQKNSRISVDTGAYHSGRLTAARCLPNGEVYFIQATHG
ncbi:serine/threonine protein phosphatase [Octadecabacter dasysiphoniae]